ncbi:condensation domain-containing protein [Granulicella mallensis]|uniref:Phthiocerol/phthiodiolone dimycocerosyl transferase n=1 Tax=Granulicella mallensis TaxID=940614 RepID=A0A7W7ZNP7_9BACT|nr:condensation domain-containing protein [Granulicella mallensis]MBB5063330.1 hypothetical protein [Granulicella mallensis]
MMPLTSQEIQPLDPLTSDLLRPLGAFEELYCLFGQHFPVNGALAAEITGHTTVQQWRDALDAIQRRHPLLSVCIDTAFNRVPHFRHVAHQHIPLRVVTSTDARWQQEIAKEINAPFTPDQSPLFRAALLYQEKRSIFILSAHHAVCDGSSRIFLLRDMLLSLSGHDLEKLPLMASRETLFGAKQRTSTEPGLPAFVAQRPAMPYVDGIKFTPEQTLALQDRSRLEGVTIHAALSAALTLAGRSLDESWRNHPLRILSPAEVRDILGLEDQCMISLTSGEISIPPEGPMTFWDLARFARDGLSTVKNPESISMMIDRQTKVVSTNLTAKQADLLKRSLINAQVMFTNLGRIPFDSTFGTLQLTDLWAPCALRGIDREQTLGAVTVNGSLHLTHTSPEPIPGLLAGIEEVLRKACTSDSTTR